MAINDKTQSPADLLAADAQSGIKDLQASADKDLIKVAGMGDDILKIIKQGESSATTPKADGPVVPENIQTVNTATAASKAQEFGMTDSYLYNFNNSEEAISNLDKFTKEVDADISAPINKKTFEDTKTLANDELANVLNMGKNYNKQNTLFSAEQVVAMKRALLNSSESLQKIAKAIKDGDDSSATLFLFRESMARHASLVQTFKYGRANIARALNSFKIPGDFVGSQGDFERLVVNELGGAKATTMMAEHILDAKNLREVNQYAEGSWMKRTSDSLMEVYINGLLSSPRTQFRNLFGNAFFQVYKIPEMTMAAVYNKAENAVKYVGSRMPITKNVNWFKNPSDGVTFEQVYARMYSYTYSYKKALAAANLAIKNPPTSTKLETAQYNRATITAENFGFAADSTFGSAIDLLGKTIRLPGTALVWGDEFFKTMAKYAEESDLAIQYAQKLQKNGTDPSLIPEMVTDYIYTNPVALKQLEEAKLASVFQDDLGPMMNSIQNAIGSVKVMGFPLLRVQVPFFKTPVNIFKAVYNRSLGVPVKALGVPLDMIYSTFNKGEPLTAYTKKFMNDPQFRSKEMGIMTQAAGMFVVVDQLVQNGDITGKPPADSKKRNYYLNTLKIQPFSFVFYGPNSDRSKPKFDANGVPNGDLRYVSYAGLEPFGSFFGITASARDMMYNSTDPLLSDSLAMSYIFATADYFKQIPFVQGMSEFFDLLGKNNDPEQIVNMEKIIKQYANVVVPYSSLGRDFERLFDPEKRYIGPDFEVDLNPFKVDADGNEIVRDDGTLAPNPNYGTPMGGVMNAMNIFQNQVASTFPGASNSLAVVYDYFGREVAPNNGFGMFDNVVNFSNAFVPFTISKNNRIKDYEADIYRLNIPGYSMAKKMNGIKFTDRQWSMLNKKFAEIPGKGRRRNMTFEEAVEELYSGIGPASRKFLSGTGESGNNDDYRIAVLTSMRKEYMDKAFAELSLDNEDFAKIKSAIDTRQEFLQENLLGRF